MRTIKSIAAAFISVCAGCAVSTTEQPSPSEQDVQESTDDTASAGSSAFGAEPDDGEREDLLKRVECLGLASASMSKKEAFCDSLLPRRDQYARCMSHRWSRIEWINWCYFEF